MRKYKKSYKTNIKFLLKGSKNLSKYDILIVRKMVFTMYNFNETHIVELKEILNDSLPKEIVAFINTDGGTIFIGITKTKRIVGIKTDIDEVQRKVSDVINDQVSPRCREYVHQRVEVMEGKQVIVIEVKPDHTNLYYIKKYGLSEKGVYVRDGSVCRPLTAEEIKKRYEATLPERQMVECESHLQKLSFDILKTSLKEHGISFNDATFLDNYRLLTKEGNYNLVADLFADENDISIKIVRFSGVDKTELIERTEYGYKSIILAIRRTMDRFEALNITKSVVLSPQRVDKKLFDIDSLREAFINAIAHTRWTDFNPPQIQVFSNRIEIISTGRVINGLSKDDFFKGISKQRNPELMRILHDLEFVEQTGLGVPRIVSKYGEGAFEFLDDFVKVTIPFDEDVMKLVSNVIKDVTKDVTKTDELLIIELIEKNPTITISEMAKEINKSTRTVQRIINSSNFIRRKGSKFNGYWEINK